MAHAKSPQSALQDRFLPEGICFGCGAANALGLRIKSFPAGDAPEAEIEATWTPRPEHQAFPGVLNGGIIGALLDCHGNWTAGWYLMRSAGAAEPPPTVTMDFHVTLRRPTPVDGPLQLSARAVAREGDRVRVEAELNAGGKVTATMVAHFVAVGPGHPAFAARAKASV